MGVSHSNHTSNTFVTAAYSISIAGSDTTAATVATFVLAMTMHPEIQKKAQEELDRVIGPDRLPTWEDRPQLPYIDAILKETLRWNTATPLGVPHALIQDDVYEGMFIPGGATVIANIWLVSTFSFLVGCCTNLRSFAPRGANCGIGRSCATRSMWIPSHTTLSGSWARTPLPTRTSTHLDSDDGTRASSSPWLTHLER